MIVFDTDVVSEPMRPLPDAGVVEWLDAQSASTLFLTTVTLAEMRFGIGVLPAGDRKRRLRDRFESEVVAQFSGRVLTFDEPAAATYAELRLVARSRGASVGGFDALIGAMAGVRGFAIATRDTTPFEAMGLPVIDPFTP